LWGSLTYSKHEEQQEGLEQRKVAYSRTSLHG
jgi:hypothetical protein